MRKKNGYRTNIELSSSGLSCSCRLWEQPVESRESISRMFPSVRWVLFYELMSACLAALHPTPCHQEKVGREWDLYSGGEHCITGLGSAFLCELKSKQGAGRGSSAVTIMTMLSLSNIFFPMFLSVIWMLQWAGESLLLSFVFHWEDLS